jgi:hypothetical protein
MGRIFTSIVTNMALVLRTNAWSRLELYSALDLWWSRWDNFCVLYLSSRYCPNTPVHTIGIIRSIRSRTENETSRHVGDYDYHVQN